MEQDNQTTLLLLRRARDGESGAQEELLPIVYAELRKIAGRLFSRERRDHTLQPAASYDERMSQIAGGCSRSRDRVAARCASPTSRVAATRSDRQVEVRSALARSMLRRVRRSSDQ